MRALPFLLLLLLPAGPLVAQPTLTLEDIWLNRLYVPKAPDGFSFTPDGRAYILRNDQYLLRYALPDGRLTDTLFDAAALPDSIRTFERYTLSPDGRRLLLATRSQKRFRHSSDTDFFVCDLETRHCRPLHAAAPQRCAAFSPDGAQIAFVAQNDLFIHNLQKNETLRLTDDGAAGTILNGAPDWVYEEEFGLVQAFAWHPGGAQLAWLRFDIAAVPEYTLERYNGDSYPERVTYRYPKAGQANAQVSVWVYDGSTGSKSAVDVQADYVPRLCWTPSGRLCITTMNRHQNQLELVLADPVSGRTQSLFQEKSERYLDLSEPLFLKDGSGFIRISEKSGYRHLYRYDMEGKTLHALTKGKFDVTACYGADSTNGLVYYQSASVNPMEREVCSVRLNGKKRRILAKGGSHDALFAPDFAHWLHTESDINTPPRYDIRTRNTAPIVVLEQNERLRALQASTAVLPVRFIEVPISDAEAPDGKRWSGTLNGWMIRPENAAANDGRLPLLLYVYGGPGSQQVLDSWRGDRYWWFQLLAQQGYAVACVDNRGTGGRGVDFQKMTYLHLGKYETADQIAAARYLGTLPFIDPARIGIFGWSYGGYMASLALLEGADVFKAGIAVAPVTHWKWYDSIYTERYMRTEEENPEGYAESAPVNHAEQLQGSYLLVHGLADDNVHFQHSAEMARRLIAANIPFESMFYPNRDHGIADPEARLHLYGLMTRFLNEHLKESAANDQP